MRRATRPANGMRPPSPSPPNRAPYARTGVSVDDLIDFTPELHQKALDLVKNYKLGPMFTPPVVSQRPGILATLSLGPGNGGTNWPGGSFNPENHTAYIYACDSCIQDMGWCRRRRALRHALCRGHGWAEGRDGLCRGRPGRCGFRARRATPAPPPANDADDFGLYHQTACR